MATMFGASFFAQLAERCFEDASRCKSDAAAAGFRELGQRYWAVAKRVSEATSMDKQVPEVSASQMVDYQYGRATTDATVNDAG